MDYLLKGIALTKRTAVPPIRRGLALLLLLACVSTLINAGAATPLVQGPIAVKFPPGQLQGESYIHQIIETRQGQLIAAGEKLGYYEANRWQFVANLRRPIIRSLLEDGDKLWVGSSGEIGWLKLPLGAGSVYHPLAMPELASTGEIWQLAKLGELLVATAKEAVWFINEQKNLRTRFDLTNSERLVLLHYADHLLVAQAGIGVWQLRGDGSVEAFEIPLPDTKDTSWAWCSDNLVITAKSLYQKDSGKFRPLISTKKLTNSSLVVMAARWGPWVAIATTTQGVALFDPDTQQLRFLTLAHGLPSLSTYSLFVDSSGRLWIGTSRGIVVFESEKFGSMLTPARPPVTATRYHGIFVGYEDGADYFHDDGSVESFGERIYRFQPTPAGLVLGTWGRVRIGKETFQTPGTRIGATVVLPSSDLLVTAGERAYLIEPGSGHSTQIPTPSSEFTGLVCKGDELWTITRDGGLYRSRANPPFDFQKISSLPPTINTLRRLGSHLIFASNDRVCVGEQFVTVQNTAGISRTFLTENADGLWLAAEQDGERRLGRLVARGDTVAWETVEAKGLAQLSEVHAMTGNGHVLTLCGDSTILELNSDQLKPAYRLAAPSLAFTYRDARTGATTTLPSPPAELDADENSLAFSGTLAFDEFGERPRFERRLLPTETAWVPTKIGEIVSYPSLSPRTYTLEVRATHLGHTGAVATHLFTVLPPWYATRSATLAYVAVAALGFYGLYRLRTHNLRRRTAELERIVEERTHALKEASEAKTEFLASMSHEIRNPMNGVIGLVDILREQPAATPKQAETLRLLQHCADQLRSTVDDILDFSRIEAGRVALERATFDLRDTLEAAAVTIDQDGAKITFLDKPAAGIALVGDVGKLRQIFANYLSNALKYGVPPGARVSTLLTETEGGVRLTVGVASTGPTIPKDTLDKFFESFTRGTDAVERNIHGTGLGLAICRKFAQAMGGEVGAVSANGETTFYLHLPFARAGAAAPATVPAPLPNALPAKALAIEDEDYNRIVLGNILAKMNYSVDWATTGAEALKLAQENGYDIILTDYRLPDTNGVELTKKILTFCPDPKPAVFAVTAYSTKERREECLGAGMAGFISKPITLEKLRTTLAGWGEHNLAKISFETSRRPGPIFTPQPPPAITATWQELIGAVPADAKRAADLAHRLNNLCRAHGLIDAAEQFELLEGALERGEPAEPFLRAGEALLHT